MTALKKAFNVYGLTSSSICAPPQRILDYIVICLYLSAKKRRGRLLHFKAV